MGDPIDDALAAWREATEHPSVPAGLADAIVRAIEPRPVVDAVNALGWRALLAAAVVAATLVISALGSVRALEQTVADYALSRGE